jgi:multiple sugar transport system ATP-binding protein
MPPIRIEGLTKQYKDGPRAVDHVDLEIRDGEFMVLVGPSGCGKSTLLQMLAGIVEVTEGTIHIGDQDVTRLDPRKRDIAMVFQSYALYPHLSVRGNLGFGLKLRGTSKAEIARRVEDVARILGLDEVLDRKPGELSGGQRQRVAMGRAIVRDPVAFLMDEPLSNLDAKLRVQMRTEVSRLQQRLGTTTIYVTHDQTEAMTLGDRVAVMRSGVLQQVGTPMELYNEPRNVFVAGFIGSPAMNFMPARVEGGTAKLPIGDVPLSQELGDKLGGADGRQLLAGIRPESFEDAALTGDARDRGCTFRARIEVLEAMGSELFAHFTTDAGDDRVESEELRELAEDAGAGEVPTTGEEGHITARLDAASKVKQGEEAELWVEARGLHLFDPDDGRNLTAA